MKILTILCSILMAGTFLSPEILAQEVEILGSGHIKNVSDPVDNQDAATKAYVDNAILSFGLSAGSFGIQGLLNAGYCPLDIITAGASKDILYGKMYQGGLIFYLDDLDSIPNIKGLVAATSDQALDVPWGCNGIDLPIPNVGFPGPPSGPGAEIGDGATNTVGIDTASCSVAEDAAVICANTELNEFDNWFLPSAKELNLMWENLAANDLVVFGVLRYWSSTECGTDCAWFQWLNTGLQNGGSKTLGSDPEAVRAVRSF